MVTIALTNVPFETPMKRDLHFHKHGRAVGALSANDYERMADEFMFGAMNRSTRQCQRPYQGDRLRFDTWNKRFGSASVAPEFLRTFFIVPQGRINSHGGDMAFFGWECGRINV